MVKVGSAVRSRRRLGRLLIPGRRGGLPGLALHGAREAPMVTAFMEQRLDDVPRHVGAPERALHLHARSPPAPTTRAHGAHQDEVADPQVPAPLEVDRHPRPPVEERLHHRQPAALGQEPHPRRRVGRPGGGQIRRFHRRALDAPGERVERALERLVGPRVEVVTRPHVRPDATSVQIAARRRVVVADHQVECAAVGEVEDLPEDSLAEGPEADDGRVEYARAGRR